MLIITPTSHIGAICFAPLFSPTSPGRHTGRAQWWLFTFCFNPQKECLGGAAPSLFGRWEAVPTGKLAKTHISHPPLNLPDGKVEWRSCFRARGQERNFENNLWLLYFVTSAYLGTNKDREAALSHPDILLGLWGQRWCSSFCSQGSGGHGEGLAPLIMALDDTKHRFKTSTSHQQRILLGTPFQNEETEAQRD